MTWPHILYLAPVVPAAVLGVSDFRRRSIPVGWLVAFGLCVLSRAAVLSPLTEMLYHILTNTLLLGWMLGGVWLYLRLRYGRQANLFRRSVGSGDLVFAVLLTPLAPLPQYLLLLLGGCLAGLAYWIGVRTAVRRSATIPLVTFLSLAFMVCTLYRLIR